MDDLFQSENQFKLNKTSYLTVGGIMKNCIKLIPPIKPNLNQLSILGDTRGVIYITQYKVSEPEILIRTEPYSKEIAWMELLPNSNKIAFSVGNSIFIINKEYTDKFKIEFDMADDIRIFKIKEPHVWAVSNNYLSQYEYGDITTEIGTYDNVNKILSIYICDVFNKAKPICILGSEDNKIKLIDVTNSNVILATKGGVNCFCPITLSNLDMNRGDYFYGTTTGSYGILKIKDEKNAEILYEKDVGLGKSEIIDIKMFDINEDGKNEMILIRADGNIEFYSTGEKVEDDLILICQHNTHESLTGIDIGRYKTKDRDEIILSSLSGLIFSLTPEFNKNIKQLAIDNKTLKQNLTNVQKEIVELTKTYNKKQEEFQKSHANSNPTLKNSFKIDISFTLVESESVFLLIIDSEFPIEMAIFHCTETQLDIIDIKTKDVQMNILEKENLDEETNSISNFLATFKVKEATHRLEILIRTYEGLNDKLNITIIPQNKPKTAQIMHVPIYALSFHKKYEPQFDETSYKAIPMDDEKNINILICDGMQAGEINQILHLIIPNIPAILKDDTGKYVLMSTFLNTLVEINLDKNKTIIKCTHLSTLITLKEQITKEANLRKKDVQFNVKFKTGSVFKILEILNPKIEEIFNLEMEYKVIKAFKELGDNVQFNDLPEEYITLLNKTEEIEKKYSNRTLNLNYYKKLVEQLLKDIRKVMNINDFNEKINDIHQLFNDYSYDKLINIFSFLNNID